MRKREGLTSGRRLAVGSCWACGTGAQHNMTPWRGAQALGIRHGMTPQRGLSILATRVSSNLARHSLARARMFLGILGQTRDSGQECLGTFVPPGFLDKFGDARAFRSRHGHHNWSWARLCPSKQAVTGLTCDILPHLFLVTSSTPWFL
jgi:hypothetical protein